MQVEKSWQALALYLACVRAGAVYLPLNTAYPLAELEYFLTDAEPSLVVCRPENEAGVKALANKLGIRGGRNARHQGRRLAAPGVRRCADTARSHTWA